MKAKRYLVYQLFIQFFLTRIDHGTLVLDPWTWQSFIKFIHILCLANNHGKPTKFSPHKIFKRINYIKQILMDHLFFQNNPDLNPLITHYTLVIVINIKPDPKQNKTLPSNHTSIIGASRPINQTWRGSHCSRQ